MSARLRLVAAVLAAIVILSPRPARTAASFAWAHPRPNVSPLMAVTFVDDQRGWAVGIAGAVLRSGDGGDTWAPVPDTWQVLPDLFDVLALDASTLVAVGDGVIRSTDGGATWTSVAVPTGERLWRLARAGDRLRAGGEHGVMLDSGDGGLTWSLLTAPGDARVSDQHWFDADTGLVTGGIFPEFGGFAARTVDGGLTWSAVAGIADVITTVVEFRDPLHGFLLSGLDALVTDDAGLTWAPTSPVPPPYVIDGIHRADGTWLLAAFGEGAFIFTSPTPDHDWSYPAVFAVGQQHGVSDLERLPAGRVVGTLTGGGLIVSDDDGATWSYRTEDAGGGAGDPIQMVRLGGGAAGLAVASGSVIGTVPNLLLRTDDGGRSWGGAAYPAAWTRVLDARVRADGLALIVGHNPAVARENLARSADGGVSWQVIALPLDDIAVKVLRLDTEAALVSAASGRLWRSVDGGLAWTPAGTTGPLAAPLLDFPSADVGFALQGGPTPRLHRTLDGGVTWQLRSSGLPPFGMMLAFADAQTGLLRTTDGVFRSTDGGASWTEISADAAVAALELRPDGRGLLLPTREGPLRLTADAGATWTLLDLPWRDWNPDDAEALFTTAALTPDGLMVGGIYTGLLKVGLDASATAVPASPTPRAKLRAAPNPFNPRTVLRFSLPQAGPAAVEIFDPRGRRVRVLSHGDLAAGEHSAAWDGRDDAGRPQPAGVYLARVRSAGAAASLKLLLVE